MDEGRQRCKERRGCVCSCTLVVNEPGTTLKRRKGTQHTCKGHQPGIPAQRCNRIRVGLSYCFPWKNKRICKSELAPNKTKDHLITSLDGHISNGKLQPSIPMPSSGQVSPAVTSLSEQCAIKRLSQTRAVGPPS